MDTGDIFHLFSFSEVDTVSECAFARRFLTNLGSRIVAMIFSYCSVDRATVFLFIISSIIKKFV